MAELWHDINDPGAFAGKPEPEESTSAAETEQTGQESPEKQEPEVKLVSAVWEVRETGFEFNKKCNLKVSAEFLKETFRKKITCQLFVVFNGQEEDLHHQVDAELGDDGAATVEMTLYYGNDYYNALPDNPEALCQYKAKVTHPTATAELESALLDMPPCMAVDFIEIADIHFNHNCALPCLDTKGELIDLLARAFVYANNFPDRELIIHGHADTSGDPDYNQAISQRRGEAIKGLLSADIDLWNGVVGCKDHKLETEDYQETLKGLAEVYGWPCDPGDVDNIDGPKTKEAVKGFQSEYKRQFDADLDVDGVVGPKTWEAIGLTLRSLLEDHLKNVVGLDPLPQLTFGYAEGEGIYPCGENCPIENPDDPDYQSSENRRVELVFYKKGDPKPETKPSKGAKIGLKKDPVSKKKWKKKTVPPKIVPAPSGKPVQIKGKLFWNRTWDYLDEKKPISAIKEYLPGAKVVLEIKKDAKSGFVKHGETFLSDGVNQALVFPHENTGEFVFDAVPPSSALRIKVALEYKDGKVVCVKGKTIKGNTKYKDEPDFKVHSGKTVEHTLSVPLKKIKWTREKNDVGDLQITKELFVDICDAYKTVWTGYKRLKELTDYTFKAEMCQINFPEDPAITVSHADTQLYLCKDDLKDRAVILHEYGHFMCNKVYGILPHPGFGYNDDVKNGHGPQSKEHYEPAWREGFATFFSCALSDNPHYHDGYDANLNMHLDTDDIKTGPHCEGSVQGAFWRIHKVHKLGFRFGFWKAFSDKSIRICKTVFDFYDNWKDLKLSSLDKVKESFKYFNMEHGYRYLDGTDRFKNVASPKKYDETKKEFATLAELHSHKGSTGGGSSSDYNEEFYNRNKHFNTGSLGGGSTKAAPKTKTGTSYIIPERFTLS